MSGTTSDPPASEAIELGAVISSEREEDPEVTQTGRDSDQASDKYQDDNSKKDVKPKSNKYFSNCRSIYLHIHQTCTLDPVIYLSKQLDEKSFSDGASFIWRQWTSRPHIQVSGFGWIFKLFLWCLRYGKVTIIK